MLKLKLKREIIPAVATAIALGFAVSSVYAAKADSINYDKPNEFRIVATNSPPKAFALQGSNNLWYGTEEILVLQPLNSKSHQPFAKMDKISSANVSSIIVDPTDRVWVAAEAGVAVRVGNNFTSYTAAEGLPEGAALCLAAGSGGEVWVGTENGAARFRDGTWTKFTTADGLPSNKIQAMTSTPSGKIYIGTDKGVAAYEGSGKFKVYNMKSGLSWNDVKVLAPEPGKESVWAAVGPQDVNYFDGKAWKQYMEIQTGITSIMNDTKRTWFGHGGGVLRFNGEEWVSDPGMHGVPVAQVNAMYRDSNGNLWFAMEKGVLMLNNPYRR